MPKDSSKGRLQVPSDQRTIARSDLNQTEPVSDGKRLTGKPLFTQRLDHAMELSNSDRPIGESLLTRIMDLVENTGPLKINFEDLTGVTYDIPDLMLLPSHSVHNCEVCLFAKSTRRGWQDCIRNKLVVNRLAISRKVGFHGQCHIGLTDIVQPLLYHNQVLGVFYYGSVMVDGTQREARRRVLRYCKRRGFNPAPFLAKLDKASLISRSDLKEYHQKLLLITEIVIRIMEAYGCPIDQYRTASAADRMHYNHRLFPALVRSVLRFVHRHYADPILIKGIASKLSCHPDYLSRVFKQHTGRSVGEYVLQVRIDHARHLLETKQYLAGEVGFMVGFQDQSHFGKVFRRLMKMTPHQYLEHGNREPPKQILGVNDQQSPHLSFFRSC
jgi:AraC-like DNA-binding protein/ligand-binding sensor protein